MLRLLQLFKGKIDYLLRGMYFYVWDTSISNCENQPHNYLFLQIENFEELDKLEAKDVDKNLFKSRFEQGHFYCCLTTSTNVIVSSGWINYATNHLVGELDLKLNLPHKIEFLYDFRTNESHRGLGLYPILLKQISKRNDKIKLIYSLSANGSSRRGIQKAKFKFLTTCFGFNAYKMNKIIANYVKNNN
ncbi:hypothetical protein [Flavobacterium sp. UBA7663]|uniref:hypothetical protein n=1 Tax=Flavobacterium sp. UBA7663 TaxID=1946557 RepID=UPI0025C5CB87|nr:hypothetical protein [Flavobacterium sp. UBA7663]